MIRRLCFVRVTLASAPPKSLLLRWRTSIKPCFNKNASASSSAASPLTCLLVRLVLSVRKRSNNAMPGRSTLIGDRHGDTVLIHGLGFLALEIRGAGRHVDGDLAGHAVDVEA